MQLAPVALQLLGEGRLVGGRVGSMRGGRHVSVTVVRAETHHLTPEPSSITWQRAGDARVLLMSGYALLLQVAHPTVGAGVSDHSSFLEDPWGRLLRTLDVAATLVYGGDDAARATGRALREMHRTIRGVDARGRAYDALEPEAYAWVHATLADGIVRGHARFGRPLDAGEREELWQDWLEIGAALGVGGHDLPPTWAGFEAYRNTMIAERLEHTAAADDVLGALRRPAAPPLPAPARPGWWLARPPLTHTIGLATIGMLPPVLRERFGVRWSGRQELELRALGASLRAATPILPPGLRNMGPHYLGWRTRVRRAA
jgi:uncharacterized protein (DUF2236 family)